MRHTYQVRDFIPKLLLPWIVPPSAIALAIKKTATSWYFTRQMFQGKLAADVTFTCDAPWFVTFQNGAFRGARWKLPPAPHRLKR